VDGPDYIAQVGPFHRLYHERRAWQQTYWFGVQTLKNPFDLWIYQEIVHRTRPDVIVETGTHAGGSALYLASMMDVIDHGRVITIDVAEMERPAHPRVTYLTGSSTDPVIVDRARAEAGGSRAMVLLDSDHSKDHVTAELAAYASLVPSGNYLVVEDTSADILFDGFGPGPHAAVEEFLSSSGDFVRDEECEKFLFTSQPGGYLRRV
jgi:cephalosporin hydroxylase